MTYRELVELLYQEKPNISAIEKLPSKIYECNRELPTEDGEYLVLHAVYGWCTYGYKVKHKWGADDELLRKDGSKFNKILRWAKLDFLHG